MTKNGEVLRRTLFGAGVAAVVIGIATIVYAIAFLGSRVSSLTEELSQNLTLAEDGLSALEGNAGLFEASFDALDLTKATMRQAAAALRSTAVTLREVESPTGIVIPGESLDESASALQNTATELDLLATGVERIQNEGSAIDMPPIRAVLADLREQIGETEEALSQASFAQGTVTLAILQGGIYILLGALALALSGLMERIERLARSESVTAQA